MNTEKTNHRATEAQRGEREEKRELPEGWEEKRLGELYDITSSKRVFENEWRSSGVPFYRAREIVKLANQGFVDNDLFISEKMYEEYSRKYGIPQENDIMVTGVGTLGICYVVKDNDRFYFKDGNIIWLKKKSDINSRFVEYAFKSDILRKQIDNSAGATVGTYTIMKAKGTTLPVPSAAEQKRIVVILDEAFAAIGKARENAEKNLVKAREICERTTVETFSNHGEDWEEKQLGDICEISSKLVDPREQEYNDQYHVGGANIESNTGKLVDLKTAKEEELISGKFTFDNSMILYSKIRPYLMKVARPEFSGLCSADIYPLKPINKYLNKDFLYHLLLSKEFTEYAVKNSARAGMPKINRESLFSYSVSIPPVAEQRRIVAELDALSAETAKLETVYRKKIADLDELKASILERAFRGEL